MRSSTLAAQASSVASAVWATIQSFISTGSCPRVRAGVSLAPTSTAGVPVTAIVSPSAIRHVSPSAVLASGRRLP
jgi:hypothetical protein